MTEERVARNAHNMVQRLEDLRIEHMSLINSLESPKTEKSNIILKNIKSIDVGLDEAQLMMEFTLHLQNVEIEKQQLNAQIKQLSEENLSLRDELCISQEKMQIFERMITEFAITNEAESIEFRMCTETMNNDVTIESNVQVSDQLRDDDSDSLTPRADQTNQLHSDESEAFSRFKSLQSQAIRYASEGKYELARPFCEQAVNDLKKTTVGRFHPYVAKMMSLVGLVYGVQSQYNEATKLLHEAVREKTQPFGFESI